MWRFIAVLIWSMLISGVVSYVLTSMAGIPFNINHTIILGIIFVAFIMFLGNVALKEEY